MIQILTTLLLALRSAKHKCLDRKEAVACVSCHDVLISSDPKAQGWHWGTHYDGTHAWLCYDCLSHGEGRERFW